MAECSHCGRDVKKLLVHPFSRDKVCMKCIARSGYFERGPSAEGIRIIPSDRRSNIRVPVTIIMSFEVYDSTRQAQVDFQAYSVNLTTEGICFAWQHCQPCKGYTEGAVHPDCVFHPYFMLNPIRKPLVLNFNLTRDFVMQLPCFVVYAVKEADQTTEYVGGRFSEVSPEEKRVLEIIIYKYGNV